MVGSLAACGGGTGNGSNKVNIPTGNSARACNITAFTDVQLPGATIQSVTPVSAGDYTPQGAKQALTDLPAFCRINAQATPSSQSLINFEVWVPEGEAWNGKLVTTGNGGYSPALKYSDMAYALRQGYATMGGDTGHQTDDMQWGVNNPEKIIDWGTRSINAITVAGKQLINELRAQPAKRSYYLGCSTGGHQGFAEAQRYPEDFDGIIAGAPGSNRTALNAEFMWRFRSNRPTNDNVTQYLTRPKLDLITRKAVAACDALDGVTDGVINDPRQCTTQYFDVGSLLCTADDGPNCLTTEQVDAARKIYQGPRNPRTNEQIYPGWPVGSESGWSSYMGKDKPVRADFWRLWVFNNENWDWWSFDFDKDLAYAYTRIAPLVDQTSTDLSAFKANGGKMIVYHGWSDPVVSAYDSIDYFNKVRDVLGSQMAMDEFYRMFLVPGMGHCGGGPGVTNLRSALTSPAPDTDILAALDRWVETGTAPNDLIATRDVEGEAPRTRPLCAYPTQAVYGGHGNPDDATSYTCR